MSSSIWCMDEKSITQNHLRSTTNSSMAPVKDFDNLLLINELLDLFNLGSVGRQWSELSQRLTPNCSRDMTDYLYGLESRKLWAIKSKYSKKINIVQGSVSQSVN